MPLRQYPHFARNFEGPATDAQIREINTLNPSCDTSKLTCQSAFDLIKDLRLANEKNQEAKDKIKRTTKATYINRKST